MGLLRGTNGKERKDRKEDLTSIRFSVALLASFALSVTWSEIRMQTLRSEDADRIERGLESAVQCQSAGIELQERGG